MLEPYRSLIETVLADQHRRLLLRLPSGSGGRAAGQEVQPLVSVYGVEEPPASLSVGSRVEAVFDAHDIKKRDILEDDWCPGVISAVNEDDVSGELTYDIAFDPDSSNPEGDQQEGVSAGHIRIPISPSERSKRKRVEQAEAAAATKARAAQEAAQDAAAARESKRKIDELQMQQQRSVSAKAGEGTSSRSIMDMFAASTAASSAEPSQTEGEDDDGPAIRAAQLLALQGNAQMATFGFSMDSIDD